MTTCLTPVHKSNQILKLSDSKSLLETNALDNNPSNAHHSKRSRGVHNYYFRGHRRFSK